MALTKIPSNLITADAISGSLIADDAIDSEHIANGAIDAAHMSANSIDSDSYVDGSIDTAHIADDQVTADKLANSINTSIAAKAPLASPTFTGTPTLSNRAKTIDGSAQLNIGQWDGTNHRIEADSNRKFVITSYHSDGIHMGGSGVSDLVIKGNKVGIGATTPTAMLEVKDDGTLSQDMVLIQGGGSSGNYNGLAVKANNGDELFKVNNSSYHTYLPNASSKLGIGIASGASAALDVVTNNNVWTGEFTQSNTSNGDGVIVTVGSTAAADYALSIRSDAGNTHVLAAKADGKVGIGEASPLGWLHIKEGDSGQSSVNSNFDQLILEDDSHSGMSILSGTSADGGIYFGDSGGNNMGQFKYKHLTDAFEFTTANGAAGVTIRQIVAGGTKRAIGINTTTPDYVLDIDASGDNGLRLLNSTNSRDVYALFDNQGTGTGDDCTLNLKTAHGAGDPKIRLQISGYEHWDLVCDNSDNDSFLIKQQNDVRMRFAGGNAQIGSETDSYTFAQKLVVGDGDANDGITIQSGTTHQGNIAFNDGGTTAKGRLSYQHGSNYMQFFVNNAEKMRINSTTSASAPSILISDNQPWIDMVAPDNSTLKAGITMRGGSGSTQGQAHFHLTRDASYRKIPTAGNYDTYISTSSASTSYGALIFGVRDTEYMRIMTDGKIRMGLGTAGTPQAGLHVMGGNFIVSGSLTKGSGSFRIDHPLESKKDTHDLVHSFTEAPQADLLYRGTVTLSSGSATVNIDTTAGMSNGTFVLLCGDVQCFTTNETDWKAVKGSVSGNTLTISCEDSSSTATVSWLVIGERKDQHMKDTEWTDSEGHVIVEPLKGEGYE